MDGSKGATRMPNKPMLENSIMLVVLGIVFASCAGDAGEGEGAASTVAHEDTSATAGTSTRAATEGSTQDTEPGVDDSHGSSSGTDGSGSVSTTDAEASTGETEAGACGARDECRTMADCEPGQYCDDCRCCEPEVLVCGTRPPPGGVYCEDDPDTMFLCPPGLECCGSKNNCYDPVREPDFCLP